MSKDWHKELARLKKATEERPDDGLAWLALGDFLVHESEEPDLSVLAYERAHALLPERDLRLKLGNALVSNGEMERGLAMMRESAVERPRAAAYCFISDAYYRNGDSIEAEASAREAIRLEPSFEEGHFLLGNALKDRDREAAIAAYRTALLLDSAYALAWQALGRELSLGGNTEEGISSLRKAVSLDPEDVWSRVYLANGLWKLRKFDEAEEQYLAALALAPEFPELQRWYEEFKQAWQASKEK